MLVRLSLILCALALMAPSTFAQGRLSKIVSTIIHDDDSKTLSTRLIEKRAMEQKTFSPRGVLQMKRLFRLDRQGKVRSGLAFDGVGNPIFNFKYHYDDLDRLSEEQIHDMKGKLVRLLKTEYDETGKAKRFAITNPKKGALKAHHQEILEHPERLEKKGKQVDGDQTRRKRP